ncbi:MAG TPA: GTPase [Syntrophobacteraceae bacterium]|nr:GTPase [Syntrophobacteraceae bacterium]
MVERVIIMGAAGRDFHNFNIYFRDNPRYQVVAFTAAQIPDIDNRIYPPELAGTGYRQGIPIHPEEELEGLIRDHHVDLVAFSYSDVPHIEVMHKASRVMAEGADFILLAASYTMLKASKPVIAVCAVRTGCGKSQTTRKVCEILDETGKRLAVVRHPMPYGDLREQVVQRFSSYQDFDRYRCTIEEREEYEPLVELGIPVYAGVDYGRILQRVEREADVIVWDGGNNDTPFFRPDIHIVLFDPHRAGHELLYYPGETNLRMADIAIINKVDSAKPQCVEQVRRNIAQYSPNATILLAESPVRVSRPELIAGKRVLVVEDGPTLTHGEMPYGAGVIAAHAFGAAVIIDPRPYAVGTIRAIYDHYPCIGDVLPAMGYGAAQIADLRRTIEAADCDLVLFATPINLTRLLAIDKPAIRVRYDYQDHGEPSLRQVLLDRLSKVEGF